MKLEKIRCCVCIEHEPTTADSVSYGMPQLVVTRGQRYSAFCPNCGRGSKMDEHKSAYLALKAWNDTQERLLRIKAVFD